MACTRDFFPEPPDGAVSDLSFRSMKGAAARLLSITGTGWVLSLIKPQFEWKEPSSDFDGVVRSSLILKNILSELASELRDEGAFIRRIVQSPIRGTKGNREFFFLLSGREQMAHGDVLGEIGLLTGSP
jgi:23S rRNA (cytidine1920-2'-O)/16S rRNA (cytidine1409-2'-O)-methyltransferase